MKPLAYSCRMWQMAQRPQLVILWPLHGKG